MLNKKPLGLATCAQARSMLNADTSFPVVRDFLVSRGFTPERARAFYVFAEVPAMYLPF